MGMTTISPTRWIILRCRSLSFGWVWQHGSIHRKSDTFMSEYAAFHNHLLITVWIVVENFVKKSGQKIWILVTCLAYTAILIFQIFCPQFIFLLLHNFSRLFVDYFSRILLTLHVVNSLLITYVINYQSIFKVVNNLLITNNETLITQKSSIFEKSFQLY